MTQRALVNDALRLVRLYWGYSQSELANKLDVSQSLISEIESKNKNVTIDILSKYSIALNIKMSQLLFFAEELVDEKIDRRGKLFVADKVIRLLEAMKSGEPAEA